MKYEKQVFVQTIIRKMIIPYILFAIIIIFSILSYFNHLKTPENLLVYFKIYAGIINKDTITNLFVILQCLLTLLGLYNFFNYELDNSPEFIKTRFSYNKIYFHKLIIYLIYIIFIRSIYFGIMLNIFAISFTFKLCVLSILPHVLITFSYYFVMIIYEKIRYLD